MKWGRNNVLVYRQVGRCHYFQVTNMWRWYQAKLGHLAAGNLFFGKPIQIGKMFKNVRRLKNLHMQIFCPSKIVYLMSQRFSPCISYIQWVSPHFRFSCIIFVERVSQVNCQFPASPLHPTGYGPWCWNRRTVFSAYDSDPDITYKDSQNKNFRFPIYSKNMKPFNFKNCPIKDQKGTVLLQLRNICKVPRVTYCVEIPLL